MRRSDEEKAQRARGERIGQRDQRVTKVAELMMQGLSGTQIHKYVHEKLGWKVTQRMMYNYMQTANEGFAVTAKSKAAEEFGKALNRLNMLFASSLKIQDFKACLAIQQEINRMMGFTGKSDAATIGNQAGASITNNTIHIEYINVKKEIAKSEDEVDTKRIPVETVTFEELTENTPPK